jgi:hypothetical protein
MYKIVLKNKSVSLFKKRKMINNWKKIKRKFVSEEEAKHFINQQKNKTKPIIIKEIYN